MEKNTTFTEKLQGFNPSCLIIYQYVKDFCGLLWLTLIFIPGEELTETFQYMKLYDTGSESIYHSVNILISSSSSRQRQEIAFPKLLL